MPDPKELLAKARRVAAKMREDGVPDAQIDAFLKSKVQLSLEQVMSADVSDYLRAAGMGATFGFLDELAGVGAAIVPGGKDYAGMRDAVRGNYAGAKETDDSGKLLAAEIAGGVGGSALGAGAVGAAARGLGMGVNAARATGLGAKALRGALTGAGAGATSGAGYSDDKGAEAILGGAAAGLVGGAALPVAGGLLAKGARHVADVARPGRAVLREARTQLAHVPGGAKATMDRLDALAPGSAVPAGLSKQMISLMRGVGSDPAAAEKARAVATGRIPLIRDGLNRLSAQYKALLNGVEMNAPSEVLDVMEKYTKGAGRASFAPGGKVKALDVQKLRTKLREKLQTTKKGSVKGELGPDKTVLDQFLSTVKGVPEIDSDWGFLSSQMKLARDLSREVEQSATNYAAQRAYGSDAGSIGGNLPSGSRGLVSSVLSLLEPNRADRARAAAHELMRPGVLPSGIGSAAVGNIGGGLLSPTGMITGWGAGRGSGLLFDE